MPFKKVMCLFVLLSVVLGLTEGAVSQVDTLSKLQFYKGVSTYREHFIYDISNAFKELVYLSDSLKAYSSFPEEHDQFIKSFFAHFAQGEKYNVQLAIDNSMPVSIRAESGAQMIYRKWGISHIVQIIQMNFLVSHDLVHTQEPFSLKSSSDLWEEVHAYGITKGLTVVDVGAGLGMISFILSYSGISGHFYLTELNRFSLDALTTQINQFPPDSSLNQMHIVVAEKKALGLEDGVRADIILMREVFHHLDYPNDILSSVRDHLNSNGALILVESVKDLRENKKRGCRNAITLKKVLRKITKNGFTLTQKEQVGERYILKFQLTNT